jgi:hypothetical protein
MPKLKKLALSLTLSFAFVAGAGAAASAAPAAQTSPEIGSKMLHGGIYAGVSPDTKAALFTTPTDGSSHVNWNEAAYYCQGLKMGGHQDWRVPTKGELNVLFQNREKGALKGTFNLTGSFPAGYYWSSTPTNDFNAWGQRFSDGDQYYLSRLLDSSVRCVR